MLGYSARAGISLVLFLTSILRHPKRFRWKALRDILLAETPLRFGLMLGLFSGTYRWCYHGLRIFNIGPRGPGKEERWHAALAGAVAGVAVVAERPAARVAAAQQIFVR